MTRKISTEFYWRARIWKKFPLAVRSIGMDWKTPVMVHYRMKSNFLTWNWREILIFHYLCPTCKNALNQPEDSSSIHRYSSLPFFSDLTHLSQCILCEFSGQKVRWNAGDLLLTWVLGSRVRETLISGHQTFTRQMPCKARVGIGVMYFCLTFSFRYKEVKPVYRKWTPISLHAPRANTFMYVYIFWRLSSLL